jgi:hypothetical protein
LSAPPRLAAHIWVSALLRRCAAENIMATVLAKGDAMAGSVSLVRRKRSGKNNWFAATSDGGFLLIGKETLSDADVQQKLERLRHNDPDAWVVELECDDVALFYSLLQSA